MRKGKTFSSFRTRYVDTIHLKMYIVLPIPSYFFSDKSVFALKTISDHPVCRYVLSVSFALKYTCSSKRLAFQRLTSQDSILFIPS